MTTTYAPGYADADLLLLLQRAKDGDPAGWQAFAREDPQRAASIIKQANATKPSSESWSFKGRKNRGKRGEFRRGRAGVQVTSGYADELQNQAQGIKKRSARYQPDPFTRVAQTHRRTEKAAPDSPAAIWDAMETAWRYQRWCQDVRAPMDVVKAAAAELDAVIACYAPRFIGKWAGFRQQPALFPGHDPEFAAWASSLTNPVHRARALASIGAD